MRVVGLGIRASASTPTPGSQVAPEMLWAGSLTTILGAPYIYFRPGKGSLVNITCVVNSLQRPEHIFWYHNGQVSGGSRIAAQGLLMLSLSAGPGPHYRDLEISAPMMIAFFFLHLKCCQSVIAHIVPDIFTVLKIASI